MLLNLINLQMNTIISTKKIFRLQLQNSINNILDFGTELESILCHWAEKYSGSKTLPYPEFSTCYLRISTLLYNLFKLALFGVGVHLLNIIQYLWTLHAVNTCPFDDAVRLEMCCNLYTFQLF